MNMKEFKEGVFVITGAGRGLGANLAKHANQNGFPVALIARTKTDLESVQAELSSSGFKVTIHPCDLTDTKLAEATFKDIREQHKRISVLVNNAGTWTGGKSVKELQKEDILHSFELNFFSAFNAIRETLKEEYSLEKPLAIINIGATAALRGGKNTSTVALAKSSLRILGQSLAREEGPNGIHSVHLIIDGLIDNERTRKLNPNRPSDRFMQMDSLSKEIIHLATQTPDCWTNEMDSRTYNADW